MAAWRIVRFLLRQQGRRLLLDRLDAVRADLGLGVALVLIGKVQYLPGKSSIPCPLCKWTRGPLLAHFLILQCHFDLAYG